MIYAWHFIKEDGTSHGGYVPDADNQEQYEGKLQLCKSGLHASERVIDALSYANGSIVRRVVCSGEIIKGDDKLVCSQRKEFWRLNITNVLHEFACRCAEQAYTAANVTDGRCCWAAIQAKRDWLAGKIGDDELDAARDAAGPAAWDAAWDAARAATRAAAWDAAWDAAWAAAGPAARAAQNKMLRQMILEERRKQC